MHLPLMGIISRAAGGAYSASASKFDGTNDYMLRGGDLTGNADGKAGSAVFWVDMNGGDAASQFVYHSTGGTFSILRLSSNTFRIRGENSVGTEILNITTTNTLTASDGWTCILVAWDLASASSGRLYFGDTDEYNETTYTNDTIDWTRTDNFALGAHLTGADQMNGCLSEFYLTNEYLDLSIAANLQKFRTTGGQPEDPSSDGSTPTGTSPLIYLPNAFGTFQTNAGTGGNFTVTGALEACASSPSD